MKHELPVENRVIELISTLQRAGFEAYIVGGAIRDLLLGRRPKDYDISTAATPEEVRNVFGRRAARIIGKRFRLVHVRHGGELFEVSTFRQAPPPETAAVAPDGRKHEELPEHMILSDNSFGTAEEDAWRRDFTVNALFYDPVRSELIDFTGQGIDDIRSGVVRAIGNPRLRFEEDPVRILRHNNHPQPARRHGAHSPTHGLRPHGQRQRSRVSRHSTTSGLSSSSRSTHSPLRSRRSL